MNSIRGRDYLLVFAALVGCLVFGVLFGAFVIKSLMHLLT
jgi:hypothetical protein